MKTLLLILTFFLSSCYIYEGTYTQTHTNTQSCELMERGQACLSDHSCCKDPSNDISYWRINYAPTVGLYYYNSLPYWGYYSGYYYYYGYRHIYPWWYYYNYMPSYYYNVTTHVHCYVGNKGYVYKPRGNWRHNNRKHLSYHHDKVKNTGVKIKNNSHVPTKWRNVNKTNKTQIKTNNRNVKTNTNYNRSNNTIKLNTNKNNKTNKINTNRVNIKSNSNKSNTKININRSNNKTNISRPNRSNKTNNRKPR